MILFGLEESVSEDLFAEAFDFLYCFDAFWATEQSALTLQNYIVDVFELIVKECRLVFLDILC